MTTLQLILKSPTDRVAPFLVQCGKSWSIRELKVYIKDIYPSKPQIESQKLIHSGKLLTDEQVLGNIFEDDLNAIVHLICLPSVNFDEDQNSDNNVKDNVIEPDLLKEYQNYLNQFYSLQVNQQMIQQSNSHTPSCINLIDHETRIKEDDDSSSNPLVDEMPPTVPNDTPNLENRPDNERPVVPAAGDNGVQNMMAAAFGGLMGDGGDDDNDGDMEPRDVLHYFYMVVRFGLLILICYYYSSMTSVVTTISLFLIFFGVNLFRRNNRVNQRIEIPIPENGVIQPHQVPANANASEVKSLDTPTEIILGPEPLPGVTDRFRRVVSTSFHFVLAFFVTLFPDPVAHINVN